MQIACNTSTDEEKTADFQVEMLPLKRAHITLEVLLFFYIHKQKKQAAPYLLFSSFVYNINKKNFDGSGRRESAQK